MKSNSRKSLLNVRDALPYKDDFISTRDLRLVNSKFKTSAKRWKNLYITGSRYSGKSMILNYLMMAAIPRYSVVYQAGVPPRLRKKVCEQLLQEISYAFRRSDRFILLLDEFDTSVELTRLKHHLARYKCIIVLASNNSHLSKLLEPTEMFELKGLTIPESISVLKNISKRILNTDSPMENNGLPMDILNLSNVLLKYTNNRTGAFISLATKLLLTGPPYDINKVLLCAPDSTRSMSSIKTIQRIIRVINGNIEIIQRNLTWI